MRNKFKKRRIIFVSSIFLISILALFFIISNFRDNIVFFYSPSELQNHEISAKINNRQVRIGGLVKEGTIKKINALTTKFIVTDLAKETEVEYQGILPDLFREKQGVVAKGTYNQKTNQFFSQSLLIKHDEKYMPPEVVKSLKEQHNK